MDPFLHSLVIEESTVLGKKLLPLSAWHMSALMFLGSPFVESGTLMESDVVLAAHVLTTRWSTGIESLMHPDTDALVDWGIQNGSCDWRADSKIVEEHIAAYLRNLPEIWHSKGSKTATSAVPWPYLCVVTILQNINGISEADAWDMPVNRLLCYRACIAENNGHELVTEKQRESIRILKQQQSQGALANG